MMTTGVLFKNADKVEMGIINLKSILGVELFSRGNDTAANLFRIPEYLTPSLTKNKTPTVSIPLLEKPEAISLGVIIPVAIKNTAAENNTKPGRMASFTKATIIAMMTMITI